MIERGWVTYGVGTAIYLIAASLTRPIFISDTVHYLATANPGSAEFWDFGHLLWRPLLSVLLRHLSATDQAGRLLEAFQVLNLLSTAAGLLGVWLAIATLRLFTRQFVPAAISAVLLSFSQAALTHSKGGCAYIFGFVALSGGLYAALAAGRAEKPPWYSVAAPAASLTLAVCLWFPYIFAVPGALLGPALFAKKRRPWRFVWGTTIICAVLGLVAYGTVAIHISVHNFRDFIGWAGASSHGVLTSGVNRVIFGFARSFVSMGENGPHGVIFKRYLLHDPYNPVHFWQIFGLALWKLALFYIFLMFVLMALGSTVLGRQAGLGLFATAVPVLGFAVVWAGTDLERYLPLFPAFLLAVGAALSTVRLRSATTAVIGIFAATLVIANVTSLSASVRERQLRELSGTLQSLNQLLPAESLVLLPPMHPLERIYWDFPEALPLAKHGLNLERIVDLGTNETPQWRSRVSAQIRDHWNKQAGVVVESSLLLRAPEHDSLWVEGDDPRVRWRDIYDFVGKLETDGRVGGTDFVRIPPTAHNIRELAFISER